MINIVVPFLQMLRRLPVQEKDQGEYNLLSSTILLAIKEKLGFIAQIEMVKIWKVFQCFKLAQYMQASFSKCFTIFSLEGSIWLCIIVFATCYKKQAILISSSRLNMCLSDALF